MSDWSVRPTPIHDWEESIDSILSIDENGTVDLKGVRKNIVNVYRNSNHPDRWFTITGVAQDRDDYLDFKEAMNNLKYKHWENGCFNYKKGVKRVVFHSREIRKKEGPFNPNLINYSELLNGISDVVSTVPFKIFSSSIDKAKHIIQYTNPYPVYNLCLEFILERYCMSLLNDNKNGIIILESRGKKEDKEILQYLVNLLKNGNRYHDGKHFSCIKGVYFNPKWSEPHNKQMSYVSLELADLVSYPIHKFVKLDKKDVAFQSFEGKICNYPNYSGYGIKIFP